MTGERPSLGQQLELFPELDILFELNNQLIRWDLIPFKFEDLNTALYYWQNRVVANLKR